jgi:hypothetical protein
VSKFGIGQMHNGELLREATAESAHPGIRFASIKTVTQAAPIPPKLM